MAGFNKISCLFFNMTFKKVAGWLHLWLGLVSGLVILIIAITGAIYAFQPELSKMFQSHQSVVPEDKPFLAVSEFKRIAETQLPGKKPYRIIIKDKDDPIMVQFSGKKPVRYYYTVYLDPYSGRVLKVVNMDNDFFRVIINGHLYLWLPPEVGHYVVIYGTLLFSILLITGIVIWWPRNKARRKSSFKVKWDASPKRLNYDLHNVFGFYASWIILFAVLTGLVWGFEWAANSEYWLLSGQKKPAIPKVFSGPGKIVSGEEPVDIAYRSAMAHYTGPVGYGLVNFPASDSTSIVVRIAPDKGLYYNVDNRYFDQYTARELPVAYMGKYKDASVAEKAVRMNYDIHVGAIAGLPGRILMFLASLITASLPVTGFYIWLGRKKKNKTKKAIPVKAIQKRAVELSGNSPVAAG